MNGSNKTVKKANTVGERITALRKEKGLTQDELAKDLHINRVTMAYWENDKRSVSSEDIIMLANYFDTTCDYLLRGVDPQNVNINRTLGLSNDAIQALKLLNYNSGKGKESHTSDGKPVLKLKAASSMLDCINAILEEPNHKDDDFGGRVLTFLHLYFSTHIDKNALIKVESSPQPIRGSDIYSARLLDIQFALIRLKERIDSEKDAK